MIKTNPIKFLFLVIAVILLTTGSLLAQPKPTSKSTASKTIAKTPPRVKFDPYRSPKRDLELAIQRASITGKRIILDVGGEWCGWCVFMDKFIALNPELKKIRDDNYVWVKVNFSEKNENKDFLSAYPPPTGFPHLYVLDETGELLHSEDTSLLETETGYDLDKFTEFLNTWAPDAAKRPPL